MRFLVIGAGNIGSLYAAKLAQSSQEVTVLARGERLADDEEALRLMVRAIRDGYQVLRANDIPITPRNHLVLEWLPESVLLFIMRRMVSAETAAIKFGHARQGRAEWMLLADEFRLLIQQAGIPTPSIDAAYRHLSPA